MTMATEAEKAAILTAIRDKAKVADSIGLKATAQNWRDLFDVVMRRPAGEILLASRIVEKPME
jgi:hypothetical protein